VSRELVLPILAAVVLVAVLLIAYTWQMLALMALTYIALIPFGIRSYAAPEARMGRPLGPHAQARRGAGGLAAAPSLPGNRSVSLLHHVKEHALALRGLWAPEASRGGGSAGGRCRKRVRLAGAPVAASEGLHSTLFQPRWALRS
jgi:hypothetical protein